MDFAGKALRMLVAVLVAVPLGPGGICCCLFGGDAPGDVEDAQVLVASGGGGSCCSSPAAPAAAHPAPGSAPVVAEAADAHEGGCDCPVRDAAVEVSPTVAASPASADAIRVAPATSPTVAVDLAIFSAPRGAAAGPEAPPGPPVRLALSVFLC